MVARNAAAHQGPPFPILMDVPAAGHVISVWADPDIGDALFYIVVEYPEGEPPRETLTASMWTEPVSGRLPRQDYLCNRQQMRNRVQFEARPYFDQRDQWKVGFQIEDPGGKTGELTTQIESTPPGFGAWDLAFYSFPFVLIGGLWIMAMLKRRQRLITSPPASWPGRTPGC